MFRRLGRRRTSNGFGANPITWMDIDAFVRHSQFGLRPWEVELIEDLDDIERREQQRAMSGEADDDHDRDEEEED